MKIYLVLSILISFSFFAQDSINARLRIDSTYAYFQFDTSSLAKSLQQQLSNTKNDKFVILHYGGSHIQAGMPPNEVRKRMQEKYGEAGPGMIFAYGAADTYSSVNYQSLKSGVWSFGKSYQGNSKVKLGVVGMGVETFDPKAKLTWKFKERVKEETYRITIFCNTDSTVFPIEILIDSAALQFNNMDLLPGIGYAFDFTGSFEKLQLHFLDSTNFLEKKFTFWGIDLSYTTNSGISYHSCGVGAAAFKSFLSLSKMPEQAKYLGADMVLLDFGTNDILYTNKVDPSLAKEVRMACERLREINPNMLIVLTSTQDLYKNKKHITAGVEFVKFMDSMARLHNCFFWNWYDLSGGYGNVTRWMEEKYAKTDGVHMTDIGYRKKGEFLFKSIENTVSNFSLDSLVIAPKAVDFTPTPVDSNQDNISIASSSKKSKYHTVKSGESLSVIASKHRTTVAKIKKLNGLRSDMIRPGQRLKVS